MYRDDPRVNPDESGLYYCDFPWQKNLAPQVGLEPTTRRLTAGCSTTELLRSEVPNPILATCRRHGNVQSAVPYR